MKNILFLIAFTIGLSSHAQVLSEDHFLPENDLAIPVGAFFSSDITEEKFNQILDRVEAVYQPIFAARGAQLIVNRNWSSVVVNASAQQRGSQWIINMYGGLARHQTVTEDGFALVACHEIGHHIGGSPLLRGWASTEGQSDYFATLKCFRELFISDDNVSWVGQRADIEPVIKEKCAESHSDGTPNQQALCVRGTVAGKSLAALLAGLTQSPVPRVETPDETVAETSNPRHPAAQCRLDTYFQGALCKTSKDIELSNTDPNIGTCSRKFGDTLGVRPLCWYKPPANLNLATK